MIKHIRSWGIALLLLAAILSACRPEAAQVISIGSLWDAPAENGQIDWAAASLLAGEANRGFELASQDAAFESLRFAEGNRQDDVQAAVRQLAEGQKDTPTARPVLALLGATSNEATARAAALANFFNLPMIVPSASGDNLLPSNNLWAFQLSAPNSAYARYLLGTVLTTQALGGGAEDESAPIARIAILYEQNTYGENAAVAAAEAAMQQNLEITVYDRFPAENANPTLLRGLANAVIDADAHIVILISSDPAAARLLAQTFKNLLDPRAMPVLVGMAGGFTSQNFLSSPEAEGVTVLRQQMQAEGCPADIQSLYAAQNYAAVKLLAYAVEEAPNLAADREQLSLASADGISAYREAVRDALKAASLNLPCLGQVAFDNAGQNKFARIELITVENGAARVLPAEELVAAVKQRLAPSTAE